LNVQDESAYPHLKAFIGWFVNERGRSRKSADAYHFEITRFLGFLKVQNVDIQACKRMHIRNFLSSRPEIISSSTKTRTLYAIRSFFKFLSREGFIGIDPAIGIEPPKITRKIPNFLTHKEFHRLIKNLITQRDESKKRRHEFLEKISESFESNHDILRTKYLTILSIMVGGVERQAIPELRRSDFNSRSKTLRIGKKVIKLDNMTINILRVHLGQNSGSKELLFTAENGMKLNLVRHLATKHIIREAGFEVGALEKLNDIFGKHDSTVRDLAIMILLLSTGIRRSELVGLNISDYSKIDKVLKITRKGGDEQLIELTDEAIESIEDYLLVRDDKEKTKALFLSNRGTRLSPEGLWLIVKEQLKTVGLEGSTHTLRHTFVTELIRQGVPLPVVQSVVGHKSPQTTISYTHILSEDRRRAVSRIKLGLNPKK